LVDPTLVEEIEAAGYRRSRGRAEGSLLAAALREAPPRRPARPDPRMRWRGLGIDQRRGTVLRESELRLDSGGIGKGLAADLLAEQLRGYERFLVDCGGDIRVGGALTRLHPYEVDVIHPLDHVRHRRVRLRCGAAATSGIDGRIWRHGDGYCHHLLDPATGEPAWTGVVSATALASSAVAAEALAKAALLSGPEGAREVLRGGGGLFVSDDGAVHAVAPERKSEAPVVQDPMAAAS
jgi:thiamine biosynthesis lipoprotein